MRGSAKARSANRTECVVPTAVDTVVDGESVRELWVSVHAAGDVESEGTVRTRKTLQARTAWACCRSTE